MALLLGIFVPFWDTPEEGEADAAAAADAADDDDDAFPDNLSRLEAGLSGLVSLPAPLEKFVVLGFGFEVMLGFLDSDGLLFGLGTAGVTEFTLLKETVTLISSEDEDDDASDLSD